MLLGGPYALLAARPEVDLIWNIAEGYGTRNREGWVPTLCELYAIPFLGSDALTLSWSLDKALTKQLARSLDIPTADWQVLGFGRVGFGWPDALAGSSIVHQNPAYEGTAKGITESSIVHTSRQLAAEAGRLHAPVPPGSAC